MLVVVVGCLLCISSVFSQSRSISGQIRDTEGEVLPGVSIVIKGTFQGAISDVEGNYTLPNVPIDATLLVSFVGMEKKEVAVQGKSIINITLTPDSELLDEIIVVGYGSMEKKDVTGSVSLVRAEDLKDRPNNQIGALIQGKAAGVQVFTNSGKPSQGFNIRVRGTNSINASSEPLYVVDGVPTTDTRSINPSDIESLTVLKDASSAAIYGAQGANGVVLITTKQGKSEKTSVNFDAYTGMSKVWKTLKVLNAEQYRDLMTEMGYSTNWNLYKQNTDWQDEIFQTGLSQNYQLSFSGKNQNTSYYVSGGWTQQKGAVRSSEMERANFKINLDQKVNNWLKLGTRVAYTRYRDVDINDNSPVGNGGVLIGALMTPPNIGIFNEDGTYTSNPFQDWENPISRTDAEEREYNKDRLLGNAFAEFELLKDLTFKTNLGIDVQYGMYDAFLDPFSTSYGRAMQGISQNNIDKSFFYIFDNTFNYEKEFGNHIIKVLTGSVIQKTKWESSQVETHGFSSANVTTPNAGSEMITASASKSEKANASFIGRFNYDYKNKYLLTANFRADGSSNFGPDERWGFFPSFSGGWRVSEESFMSSLDFLSDLKVRLGWGIVGNDNVGQYAYFGTTGSSTYAIGGQLVPAPYPATMQNNSLKWEESKQTNVGIDASLFNSRLRLSADAYIKNTEDLLLNAPLPESSGYNQALQNIGALENKGMEFSIGANVLKRGSPIQWGSDFNISFNQNKVTELVGQEIFTGGISGRGNASWVVEGKPLGTLYGYVWGGVDPVTGNAYYIDADGNSTFTPDADKDRQVIGDANPIFFFGFNNTFSYKNVSLTVFLEGMQGNDMLNATRIETEAMATSASQLHSVTNRWRKEGDQTDIPKATPGLTENSRISTRFIEDGSYLRVKSVNLTYQLPKMWVNKIKLEGVKVYVTAENLFTFTNYSGYDPEVNTFGASNTARGIDFGTYPQTRNIIFGLNVTL